MSSTKKLANGTKVFNKTYTVLRQLGTGAFGEIFEVSKDENQSEHYAVKAQNANTKHPQLIFQSKLYKYLTAQENVVGIPNVYESCTQNGYNLMMMDLLGKSLEEIFVAHSKKFSEKTVLMIGLQLIERIEFMHNRKFLHRDIKPDNLLMGIGKKAHIMYLVDMGLAKKFSKNGKHIPMIQGKQLTGTARYASISTHKGYEQARRDDIESMAYVLMYFFRGILPWQNRKAKTTSEKYNKIMHMKISTEVENLCEGHPKEMVTLINYARNLKFEEKPDYAFIKGLFRQAMERNDYKMDYKYDWTHQ